MGEESGLEPGKNSNHRLNWPLIRDILQHQESLLTSAGKLRARYHLDLCEEICNVSDESEEASECSSSSFSKIMSRLKPSFKAQTARVVQSSNRAISTMRWASVGEQQVLKVIEDIAKFNDDLYRLLETFQQSFSQEILSNLMRDLISHTTNCGDLHHLQEILSPNRFPDESSLTAAASLKRIRLLLGVDKRPDEEKPEMQQMPTQRRTLTVLKTKKLTRSKVESPSGLEIAHYSSKPVVVEWKDSKEQNPALVRKQVEELTCLLISLDTGSFHTLECRGFLQNEALDRYALVYDTPQTTVREPIMRTLREGFQLAPRPSLNQRVTIAIVIAESVLQLHTAGWLHKGIRPDNVIFMSTPEDHIAHTFAGAPYLLGYENSRADRPEVMTQTVTTLLDADVYKHPDTRGQLRARFRKRFDMYALGCVLIELCMWQELLDIFTWPEFLDLRSKIEFAKECEEDIPLPALTDRLPEIRKEVAYQAGDSFCAAVLACFDPEDGLDETSLEAQIEVVKKLKGMKI